MRKAITSLLLALAVPAQALITYHKSEPIYSDSWARGLENVINHKTRVSGRIGPLGPSARFQFSAGADALNEIFQLYAKVQQPQHTLYLSASIDEPDFELSVTHDGQGFLLLNAARGIPLEQIKIPREIRIEVLPSISKSLDPEKAAEQQKAEERIKQFIAARDQKASEVRIGEPFPEILALFADGNAINARAPWPAAFTGKHVLLMVWSLKDPPKAPDLARLTSIRQDQPSSVLQIVSLCVGSEWEPWLSYLEREKSPNTADWWQVFENPSTLSSQKWLWGPLPRFLLIAPDRRLLHESQSLNELIPLLPKLAK